MRGDPTPASRITTPTGPMHDPSRKLSIPPDHPKDRHDRRRTNSTPGPHPIVTPGQPTASTPTTSTPTTPRTSTPTTTITSSPPVTPTGPPQPGLTNPPAHAITDDPKTPSSTPASSIPHPSHPIVGHNRLQSSRRVIVDAEPAVPVHRMSSRSSSTPHLGPGPGLHHPSTPPAPHGSSTTGTGSDNRDSSSVSIVKISSLSLSDHLHHPAPPHRGHGRQRSRSSRVRVHRGTNGIDGAGHQNRTILRSRSRSLSTLISRLRKSRRSASTVGLDVSLTHPPGPGDLNNNGPSAPAIGDRHPRRHSDDDNKHNQHSHQRTTPGRRQPRLVILARNLAIRRLTRRVVIPSARLVGSLFFGNVTTGVGRALSVRATGVITRRFSIVIRARTTRSRTGGIARVVSTRSLRDLRHHPPIIAVVNRMSRKGAALLSSVHGAGITRNRTNNVARRVKTCRISIRRTNRSRRVIFLSAPNRRTFATVQTENAHIASVTVLIITTSSKMQPRAVRTVDRTGTTRIPLVITVGGMSGSATGPSQIGRRLVRRNLIPRR